MKKVFVFGAICFFLIGLVGLSEVNAGENVVEVDIVCSIKDGKPVIKVCPDILDANFGDTIVWKSNSPFAIHFGLSSPVEGLVFCEKSYKRAKEANPEYWAQVEKNSDKDWSKVNHIVTAKVVHDPERSGGKKAVYYIAAFIEHEGVRRVGIIDPDIVIPPRY